MKSPKEVALLELSQRTTLRYLKKGDPQKFMGDGKKFAKRMKGNEAAKKKLERLSEAKEDEWERMHREKNWRKDPEAYKPGENFHSGGHGYFRVGNRVNTPETYSGVKHGKVIHAFFHPSEGHRYVVRHSLPKDHPDAVDSNGEHTRGSHIKEVIHSGETLTKHNPEK